MDEVLIRIDVESDPAVVGIEKVERALHRLDDEQGRVAKSADQYHRNEKGQFAEKAKAQVSELERYKTGAKIISSFRREIEQLTGAEIKRRSKLSEAAKQEPVEIMKVYDTLTKVQTLRARMADEVQGQTGKNVAEITRMGKTIETVAKQQKKADDAAIKSMEMRRAADEMWARNRTKLLIQAGNENTKFDNAQLASAQRVADGRARIEKDFNTSSIKRTRERGAAEDLMNSQMERRAARFLSQPHYNSSSSLAQDLPGFGSSGTTIAGANQVRAAYREMDRAAKESEANEAKILEDRKRRWRSFFETIAGGGKRGGGFRSGGTRRAQFSDNPFFDTGGRGIQPRNLLIGSAIGAGVSLAGPVGAAVGGLAGMVPGAAFGLGSAIAAIKMSGLGQVADQASKIRTLQNQIATGAIKEAKGRAQIAAILKGMTPDQKKALELWKGFYSVTQDIGTKVNDVLLPAFGEIGKALGANSSTISNSIVTAGKAIGGFMTTMAKFISSGPGKVLFSGTAASGNTFITGLFKQLGDLSKVFLSVGNASQKFMRDIMGKTSHATGQLAAWAISPQGNKEMKDFFAVAERELIKVVGLVKAVGAPLLTIFKAALPYANRLIDGLISILKHFDNFLNSARGKQDLKNFFDTATAAVKLFTAVVAAIWPYVSTTLGKLGGAVKLIHDNFGNAGIAVDALGAVIVRSLAGAALTTVKNMTQKLAAMAIKNPWVAALAGTALLVASFLTAKNELDVIKSKALDAAAAVRSVFDAKDKKKLDKADLVVAKDRVTAAKGTLGSGLTKLARDTKKRNDMPAGADKTAITNTIEGDIRAIDRFRAAIVHAETDYKSLQTSIDGDNKAVKAGVEKAAKSVSDAFTQAVLHVKTQFFAGMAPDKLINAKAMDFARQKVSEAFLKMGNGADDAGRRTKLAMDWIGNFIKRTGHIPTQKQINIKLNDLASKSINQILLLVGKVKDKHFKIVPNNVHQTMMDIANIDKAPIKDKHFSIIGNYSVTTGPLFHPPSMHKTPNAAGVYYYGSGGGVPGSGSGDTVPAMLTPGEVVLNKDQQRDFGGPAVFKNYFANKPVQHFATGGIVFDGPKGHEVAIPPTYDGPKGKEVIVNPATGSPSTPPMQTVSGPAEPGMASVIALLKNQQPAIKMWQRKIMWEQLNLDYLHDVTLHDDYDQRSDLTAKLKGMAGKKDAKGKTYWQEKRKAIYAKQHTLGKKIVIDQMSNRHANERLSDYKKSLGTVSKVFNAIPGHDAFQGQLDSFNNELSAIVYNASLMPALDPNAPDNAPTGINTLNATWAKYNTAYTVAGAGERQAIANRVSWLGTLLPGLSKQPKFTNLVNAEMADDQNTMTSILGKSLSDAVPAGAGPGDAVTNPQPGTWDDMDSTKAYLALMAKDASDAAYALISNDPTGWTNAMNDERDQTWARIQGLQGAKDFGPYAAYRPDILDEITSDSGTYSSIVSAIQGGFAAASGANDTSGSEDSHLQEVIDAANTLMNQINLGSTVEREQLFLLTDYLKSQVPSFETGASYVSKTGLAKVHQGERITPRGDVAGGGGYAHLELHPTGDALMDVLIQHIEPKITYKQGQSARRRGRERRR